MSMATPSERSAVWEAMLESEYQRRYWHSKASQFSRRERYLQIFLAIVSSSAMLTALSDLEQLWVWKVLSVVTAIVATTQPFLNYTRLSTKMLHSCGEWHHLEVEYESMWRSIDNGGYSEEKFRELRNKGVKISNEAADLPFDDKKIQRLSYDQVLVGRGIKHDL